MQNRAKDHNSQYWTGDSDESVRSQDLRNLDADVEPIFEMDEIRCKPRFCESVQSHTTKPPLGRLRREAATKGVITKHYEFPGMFVEGFRNGNVDFNIPGIMQGALKPTDSIEVKINLLIGTSSSEVGPSSSTDPTGDCHSRFGSFGAANTTAASNPGRFGMSNWQEDTGSSNQITQPQSIDQPPFSMTEPGRFSGLGINMTTTTGTTNITTSSTTDTITTVATGTTTNTSLGTRDPSESLYMGSRFFPVHQPRQPFGYDSTDSGLNSNYVQVTDPYETNASELVLEHAELPARFNRFNYR